MALQSKMTVYVAIAGVLAMMGGIVFYSSLDTEKLEQSEIRFSNIELTDINTIKNQAEFEVTFNVKNPSDKTFTVSLISYQIFADGVLLGTGQYSTQDIALPGRAVFYPGAEVPLKSTFAVNKSVENAELYESAINNNISSYSAEGNITTETSWTLVEKDFKSDL